MLHLRYLLSVSLAVLNPLHLGFVVAQLAGQLIALIRVRGHVPAAGEYRQKMRYTLPLRGQWLVYNGGPTPESSHSWDLVAQRYAYDLVIADAEGRRHRSAGRCKEDYFSYGAPIMAPADGMIVRVRDGVRDSPHPGTGWIDWLSRDPRGNFVLIRHADGEYSLLGHLSPGSIQVREGQTVRRGVEIGRCVHSGHSTEPHLHFQLQDHPNFFLSVGLPVQFDGVSVNGWSPMVGCSLQSGMRVKQA